MTAAPNVTARVIFIGAGPGESDLITVRGAR
jgi:precorrin-4 methylase